MTEKKPNKSTKSQKGTLPNKSLTKIASLNALAAGSEYFAKLVVGFVTTTLMVRGLGDYFFGLWQVMNRMFGYISTTVGTTSPLEWTLAKEQSSTDYDQKRSYVGSSLIIWIFFLPLISIAGGIIAWFSPAWLSTPAQYIWVVRTVAGLFILYEALTTLSFLPYSILRGQNQGYRRLGLSIILIIFNEGLVWLALYLKTGIIGISIAAIVQLIITAVFYIVICKIYIPWFGIKRPSFDLVKRFLGLSGWYLAGDIVSNITFASDVVILGLLNSVESVTSYTLTKYIPETMISLIAIVVVGILPGLGGIIGTGDLKKASQVRGELFSLTWLVITLIGTCILMWNRVFLTLWVGSSRYAGAIPNLLVVIVVAQIIMIRTDGSIIDTTLRVQRKVLLGALSAVVSIILASILIGWFKMGVVGVLIGTILGRSILSFYYPSIVSRFLGISLKDQLKAIIRPVIVMAVLFTAAFLTDVFMKSFAVSGIKGWLLLVLGVLVTAAIVLVLAAYSGLSASQRNNIVSRLKAVISK